MGRAYAEGLAQATDEALIELERAVELHLTTNHYPPVSRAFVGVAVHALSMVSEGRAQEDLTMPNGLVRSAYFIVDGLHLWPFLEEEESE